MALAPLSIFQSLTVINVDDFANTVVGGINSTLLPIVVSVAGFMDYSTSMRLEQRK